MNKDLCNNIIHVYKINKNFFVSLGYNIALFYFKHNFIISYFILYFILFIYYLFFTCIYYI